MFAKPNLLNDYHLLSYDEVDSTNEEARRLAEGGGAHGAVLWAKRQTAGRGRMGRHWVSREGNLFCSVLLAPSCAPEIAAQLSFVTAVAVIKTLQPIVGEAGRLACKWPNDILFDGRKLGGILLESFETKGAAPLQAKPVRWVVAGVGINIESCPEQTDLPATFLKAAGVEIISAKIVLSRFIHHFITEYDQWSKKGFAHTRKSWMDHAFRKGEEIEVRLPDRSLRGVFEKIDESGQLILKPERGKRLTISAGDVFWREEMPDASRH
jgi:BirA family biotin operon repressor/biotin-[acetyl-CoA-carboxylase] ligase